MGRKGTGASEKRDLDSQGELWGLYAENLEGWSDVWRGGKTLAQEWGASWAAADCERHSTQRIWSNDLCKE